MTSSFPRVRALSVHAGYRCRSTGACCSSGWDIPAEPAVEEGLRAALRSGALRPDEGTFPPLRHVAGLPHGAQVVLRTDDARRCVFLGPRRTRPGLCAVHHELGEGALPSACRQFPRVVTLTPLGVSITLSHYCPTVAARLFVDGSLRVVENPPGFPTSWPYEGLDARDALPPLLRPGVLMDWPSLERWERFAVSVVADEVLSPEGALDVLAAAAEDARRWTPEKGPFDAFFAGVLSSRVTTGGTPVAFSNDLSSRGAPFESGPEARPRARFPAGERRGSATPADPSGPGQTKSLGMTWPLVADCVPRRALVPPAPVGLGEADGRWVSPRWRAHGGPVRRWLAAKAFASWLTLQGDGLRTVVLGLRVALGVLRAEASRGCAEAGRPLDDLLLEEAFRRTDLLLVHLVDPVALAGRLGRCESAGGPPDAW